LGSRRLNARHLGRRADDDDLREAFGRFGELETDEPMVRDIY
jgi:hypothetical protein